MTLSADELKTLQDAYAWGNDAISAMRVHLTRIDDLIKAQTPTKPLIYSQRDPLWANAKLGTGATTIGQEGCLMTDVAQMLTELDHVMTPAELNLWLLANGGYVSGNHFVFAAVDKIGATKFRTLGQCVNVPAPMDVIEQAVTTGYVIAQVDFSPAPGVQQHWVVYRGNGQVTDPWYGDQSPITRYGKDAATAIIGYAIYDKVTP